MIDLFNSQDGTTQSFESYTGLYKHIMGIEHEKILEVGSTDWCFIHRSHKVLALLYWRSIKALDELFTPQEQEACEKGLSLLEICKGSDKKPVQILVTADMNIKEMRKSWCRDYCIEHGYQISEKRSNQA